MFGGILDVSAGCGHIAWGEVPDSYPLVFLRATQGTRVVDPLFDLNLQGALGGGRMVVPYHIVSAEPADLQAAHFARTTGLVAARPSMLAWLDPTGLASPAPLAVVEALVRNIETATKRLPVLRYAISEPSASVLRCPWMKPADLVADEDWLFRTETILGVVPGVLRGRVEHVWWNGTEDELERFFRTGALPGDGGGALAAGAGDDAAAGELHAGGAP